MATQPSTAAEVNAWFEAEVQKLKDRGFVHGDLADRYYEYITSEVTDFDSGDEIWERLEYMLDSAGDTWNWLYYQLDVNELQSLVPDPDDMDNFWMTEPGDLSVSERITRTYVDHLTGTPVNDFREAWEDQFGVDFANEKVIVP